MASKRSIHCPLLLTPEGWVSNALMQLDEGGMIVSLAPGEPEPESITLTGPAIPGMPNCHSHAFQRQMAGLAGARGPTGTDSFWTWREVMYELANKLDPDQIQAIARWLYVEMLESGYTSCAEFHYLHHDPQGREYEPIQEISTRLLDAASEATIPLTLLPVLYTRSGFDADEVAPGQRRFANSPERFGRLFENCVAAVKDDPLQHVGLGLHSLRAVSREQMLAAVESLASGSAAVHIHVAEQEAEVEQCLAAYGARPVEWLLANFPVDRKWCLVHATHMNVSECLDAAGAGAVAGLCPTTEADLGDGFFDARLWDKWHGCYSIGSDSNVRVSPREELRLLEFGVRLTTGERNIFARDERKTGRALYESAALGGRRALGQAVGRIATGYRADLVELDHAHPLLQCLDEGDILDRYVFAGGKEMIKSVFIGGRRVVEGGSHFAREEARRNFNRVMEDISK